MGTLGWKLLKNRELIRLGLALLLVLVTQIGLGIANLILHLPLVLAVLHNFTAGLLVVIVVILNSKITSAYHRGFN